MKKIIYLILSITPLFCLSQTKLIAHKSHSGKSNNFHKAVELHSNLKYSNFGLPSPTYINVDTLKYISDDMIVRTYTDSNGKIHSEKMNNPGLTKDITSVEANFKNNNYTKYPHRFVTVNFEIKDSISYYKAKYRYVNFENKKEKQLDTVELMPNGVFLLKTTKSNIYKNVNTLQSYQIFNINELHEAKWLMSQSYNIEKTVFKGFKSSKKPEKGVFKSVITSRNPVYFEKMIRKNDSLKRVSLKKEKITKKEKQETTPVFNTNNTSPPPFNFTYIIIGVIVLISLIIGFVYKTLASKKTFENI